VEELEKTGKKIDALNEMVQNLHRATSGKSSKKTKRLIDDIVSLFEQDMNNDLSDSVWTKSLKSSQGSTG